MWGIRIVFSYTKIRHIPSLAEKLTYEHDVRDPTSNEVTKLKAGQTKSTNHLANLKSRGRNILIIMTNHIVQCHFGMDTVLSRNIYIIIVLFCR